MHEREGKGVPALDRETGKGGARSPLIYRETGATENDATGSHARQKEKDREPHSP